MRASRALRFYVNNVPKLISAPAVVAAAGIRPKRIEEFAGRVNSGHADVSVARMTSPSGWQEPGQRPEFEEITALLRGMLRVEHDGGALDVQAGQAVVTAPGEWVRYSTPGADGAEYVPSASPRFPRPPSIATSKGRRNPQSAIHNPQYVKSPPSPDCHAPSPLRLPVAARGVALVQSTRRRFTPDALVRCW